MAAPLALFVYNRPWHTEQTLEALRKNTAAADTDLHVFSDAPRNEAAVAKVDEVRRLIASIPGFRSVTVVRRETNLGLADSIFDGVTRLTSRHGRAIVVEDDLVTSPYFLEYMNAALDRYADRPAIYSITGYSYTSRVPMEQSTYFLKLASSWGWATWHDRWRWFRRDPIALAGDIEMSEFRRRFNFEDRYDYAAMARAQLEGRIDSWAIYWHYHVFRNHGLVLYPARSLVQNIGFDGSGTHSGREQIDPEPSPLMPRLTDLEYEDPEIRSIVGNILDARFGRPSGWKRLASRAIRYLKPRVELVP